MGHFLFLKIPMESNRRCRLERQELDHCVDNASPCFNLWYGQNRPKKVSRKSDQNIFSAKKLFSPVSTFFTSARFQLSPIDKEDEGMFGIHWKKSSTASLGVICFTIVIYLIAEKIKTVDSFSIWLQGFCMANTNLCLHSKLQITGRREWESR